MKKDQIMKLALVSGFAKILDEHASEYRDFTFELSQDHYPELERFISLVAAAEREECAKLCEETYDLFVREKPSRASALDAATAIRARTTT